MTQKRTLFLPSFAHFYPVSKSEHVSLSEHILARKRAHTRALAHSHSKRCRSPYRAPRGPAATSCCRTGGSRVFPRPSHPPATSPSQLAGQQPQRPGQTGRQRRCGQRRQHHLLASGRGAPRHRLAHPHLTQPRRPTRRRRPPPPRPPPQQATPPVAHPLPRTRPPPALRPSRPRSRALRGGAPRSAGACA